MSEILTGPDRGPPKTDWRMEAERRQIRIDKAIKYLSESTDGDSPCDHNLAVAIAILEGRV